MSSPQICSVFTIRAGKNAENMLYSCNDLCNFIRFIMIHVLSLIIMGLLHAYV